MLSCYSTIDFAEINTVLQGFLPSKPYCSDNIKKGLIIRPRSTALKKKYIQMNPPHQIVFFTIDIDYRVYYAGIAEDYNLPQPIWCVGNARNGHVHLIYALNHPVYCTDLAHLAPLKYLKAIINAYCERLGADPMYSGLISKNPWSDKWIVFTMGNCLYDLDYLADYVDLSKQSRKPPEEEIGIGRNCDVFAYVRVWSYSAIRKFWGKKYSEWFNAVKYRCMQENAKFSEPLYEVEINQIAKSIARWTWKRLTPDGFAEWHKQRWGVKSQREEGMRLLLSGLSVDEVASELGVHIVTVYRWLKEADPEDVKKISEFKPETLTELKPWEAEGISRATYYRKLKK